MTLKEQFGSNPATVTILSKYLAKKRLYTPVQSGKEITTTINVRAYLCCEADKQIYVALNKSADVFSKKSEKVQLTFNNIKYTMNHRIVGRAATSI